MNSKYDHLKIFYYTKEFGNRHDPHLCLVWIPEIDKIPRDLWNHVTDEKRGERVRTIAGLPIGHVPRGLSECFWTILENSRVDCINWYVTITCFSWIK